MINHPNRGPREQEEADKALLARQLRAWRDARDLTASEAAEVLHLPYGTVVHIEQCRGFKYAWILRAALGIVELP